MAVNPHENIPCLAGKSQTTRENPPMADPSPLVLVVEDDEDARANLCDILELDGYRVDTAGTVSAALNRSNWTDISIIILDYRLPDGNAEILLPKLRQLAPHADVIVST